MPITPENFPREGVEKPYVVVIHKDNQRERYALDRGYNLMKSADIDGCTIGDIVQSDVVVKAPYARPDWAKDLIGWIVLWFNYYD